MSTEEFVQESETTAVPKLEEIEGRLAVAGESIYSVAWEMAQTIGAVEANDEKNINPRGYWIKLMSDCLSTLQSVTAEAVG